MSYSDSCGFQNVLDAVVNLFNFSQSQQDELKNQYQAWKDDPKNKNNTLPRIHIARLHYPLELITRDKGERTSLPWSAPITKEEADELGCYDDRSTPAHLDDLLKFNPTLGKGQAKRSKKKFAGKTLLRIAPCASIEQVTELAAEVQNQGDDPEEQSNLIDIGRAAMRLLGQQEIVVEETKEDQTQQCAKTEKYEAPDGNQPKKKRQRTGFSTESSALSDAEFVRQVAIEFDRRGYVFGLNLKAKEAHKTAADDSSGPAPQTAPATSLPLNIQFHPSTTRPTSSESNHWSYMYSKLEYFYKQNGHCNVPTTEKTLYGWTKAQRLQWNDMKKGGVNHYMSIYRIKKLMVLGFDKQISEHDGA